jgi:hypothetical protein
MPIRRPTVIAFAVGLLVIMAGPVARAVDVPDLDQAAWLDHRPG